MVDDRAEPGADNSVGRAALDMVATTLLICGSAAYLISIAVSGPRGVEGALALLACIGLVVTRHHTPGRVRARRAARGLCPMCGSDIRANHWLLRG